jgi:hypothetical protein
VRALWAAAGDGRISTDDLRAQLDAIDDQFFPDIKIERLVQRGPLLETFSQAASHAKRAEAFKALALELGLMPGGTWPGRFD